MQRSYLEVVGKVLVAEDMAEEECVCLHPGRHSAHELLQGSTIHHLLHSQHSQRGRTTLTQVPSYVSGMNCIVNCMVLKLQLLSDRVSQASVTGWTVLGCRSWTMPAASDKIACMDHVEAGRIYLRQATIPV
jgi:hypothetical protein